MRRMLYVTNIVTPYRNYRFNILAEKLKLQNIDLVVLYMNESESDRSWDIDYQKMRYEYKIFSRSRVKKMFGMWMHFPLGLFKYLKEEEYDYLVLGGIASPAHMYISLTKKDSVMNILSVESNITSVQSKSKLAHGIKKFLISKYDYFQVTGKKAIDYVNYYIGDADVKYVTLPNVIDEEQFVKNATLNPIIKIKSSDRVKCLIPARLIPKKGIVEFLSCLKSTDNIDIYIAGDGPLYDDIMKVTKANDLSVKMLGYVDSSLIPSLMSQFDFLILPSKSDPYPLSVIEACFLSVPLLVSRNIGNCDDVLIEGVNGFSFDFDSYASVRKCIDLVLSTDIIARQKMKVNAKNVFNERFRADLVIDNYIRDIINL